MHRKVVPFAANETITRGQYLLTESRNIALKYLPALLQRMLDNADDILFELADKAQVDRERNAYFDAMRELRLARHALESGFERQLQDNFDKFPHLRQPEPTLERQAQALNCDDLSLVDDIELEESLAVNGMAAKIRSRYSRQLYALEQRYQTLFHTAAGRQMPIGATALCEAFTSAVRSLQVELKIKLIIYKLFDRHVLANLEPLYDETNVLLISAGILPKLKMRLDKTPGDEHDKASPQNTAENTAWLDDGAASPTRASLERGAGYHEGTSTSPLTTLQILVSGSDDTLGAEARGGMTTLRDRDAAELIAMLSRLQRFNLATSTEALHEFQAELIDLKRSGKISAVDNDIIDIVDMLFDFILDDDHLPNVAKALLARLQIPMIKVALVDRRLFGNKNHPARQLLNLMAKACMGLSNEVTPQDCPLIASVEATVNRICNEFNHDTGLFDQLLKDFRQFLQNEAEHEHHSLRANRERMQAREQHALSRAWVTDVIATTIDKRPLPKVVFQLLDGPWKEVMIQTYLYEGQESDQWHEQLRFIDLLIWSVEPGVDRQRLGKMVPTLIQTLRQESERVSYSASEVDALLSDLEALHLARLRGTAGRNHPRVRVKAETSQRVTGTEQDIRRELDAMRQSLAELGDADEMMRKLLSDIGPEHSATKASRRGAVAADPFSSDVEEIVMSSAFVNAKTIPEIDDEAWALVRQLQPGQWISLTDNKGKQHKIKLSWKSDLLGECTFINWKFKIAADLSFNQLAAKFRAGQAKVMEHLPIFERAVDALINTLQRHPSG